MGFWNCGIMSNDLAWDVKAFYVEALEKGFTDEEAHEKVYQEMQETIGTDEEPLFWYALAAVQWKNGRLMPSVKEKALLWIESDGGTELWDDDKAKQIKWRKNLQELKDILSTEQPERKVYKKREFETNLWNVGDIYAYQFHTKEAEKLGFLGKYILLHKIGEEPGFHDEVYPRIQVYNRLYDELPGMTDVTTLPVLPMMNAIALSKVPPEKRAEPPLNMAMLRFKERQYAKKYFTYVGNVADPYAYPIAGFWNASYFWNELESLLCAYIPTWREFDFVVENGIVKLVEKQS